MSGVEGMSGCEIKSGAIKMIVQRISSRAGSAAQVVALGAEAAFFGGVSFPGARRRAPVGHHVRDAALRLC
jgi:hypothetical protein